MFQSSKQVSATILLLSVLIGSSSHAQQKTVNDGVFTSSQVAAGQVIYDENCKNCHDEKFYDDIWGYWQDKPLLDFWFTIVAEMPADNPGTLLDEEYTDIVAYILSERGYPPGDTMLDRYNGMDQISIVAP